MKMESAYQDDGITAELIELCWYLDLFIYLIELSWNLNLFIYLFIYL